MHNLFIINGCFNIFFQTAVVGDDTADMLLTKLHRPLFLVACASYISAIVGLALVLIITFFTFFKFIRAQMGAGGKKKKVCMRACLFERGVGRGRDEIYDVLNVFVVDSTATCTQTTQCILMDRICNACGIKYVGQNIYFFRNVISSSRISNNWMSLLMSNSTRIVNLQTKCAWLLQ